MPKGYKHYTDEQIDYLRQIAYKRTRQEITDLFNKKFGTNKTVRSIGCQLSRKNIKTGMQGHNTRLKKGNTPWNKGMEGLIIPGSEKGWFKKGHTDKRSPIGSERMIEGWKEIKIADPDVWVKKHRYVWEQAHGEIPHRHVITFKDGNRENCDLSNLFMVSQNAVTTVGKRKQQTEYPELNETIYRMTELEMAANSKLREMESE